MTTGEPLSRRAEDLFREAFHADPTAVVSAPGRINVIGEHTDYNDGFVLPAAIDRYVTVAFRPRPRGPVEMVSDQSEARLQFDGLPAQRQGTWGDYVIGVARALGDQGVSSFELAATTTIPIGAGLSSSAALEVASVMAMVHPKAAGMPLADVARLCRRVENDFIGARTGIMDPFISLAGRAGTALLLDCRSLQARVCPLPGDRWEWVLADTRVKHENASSAYNERRAACEAAAKEMGVPSLRDATEADVNRLTDPVLRARARHVVAENARTLAAATVLESGDPQTLGPLLFASHASLKNDFEVSCEELDALVELAASAPGVIGARMMGGGFGGCVLILVAAEAVDPLQTRLAGAYAGRFGQPPAFYRVRAVDGAWAIDS
ncbi:MAG TPA: galactokinase [Candidatus Eisenbacteria bacterium]|nr:galactokinase [Candidatus Eisenbacteria bacterium]